MLTGIKLDLADQDPSGIVDELQLDELGDVVLQVDNHVPARLESVVLNVGIRHWSVRKEFAADAEEHYHLFEDAHVLREIVVAIDSHGRKIPRSLELEYDLERAIGIFRVLPPANPRVALNVGILRHQSEIGVACIIIATY